MTTSQWTGDLAFFPCRLAVVHKRTGQYAAIFLECRQHVNGGQVGSEGQTEVFSGRDHPGGQHHLHQASALYPGGLRRNLPEGEEHGQTTHLSTRSGKGVMYSEESVQDLFKLFTDHQSNPLLQSQGKCRH